jgi:hypothetical protein
MPSALPKKNYKQQIAQSFDITISENECYITKNDDFDISSINVTCKNTIAITLSVKDEKTGNSQQTHLLIQ